MSVFMEPKLNNALLDVQNIVRKKCGELPRSKLLSEAREVEGKSCSKERRIPFAASSKQKVFVFSDDEEDALQESVRSSSESDKNLSKPSFKKRTWKSPSKRVDLSDKDDDNELKVLATQLDSIKIDGLDVNDADSEPETSSNNKKCFPPFMDKNKFEKSKKVRSKPQKENIDVKKRTTKLDKLKTRKPKRKDSFIVSEDSSISDDADDVTIYHQILTKSIRADVRRMTPKARSRKKIPTYDDRMFNAYIITKRSGSEYSSSDDEQNTQLHRPSFSNSNLKNENSELSDNDRRGVYKKSENDSSSDFVSTVDPRKKDCERLTLSSPVSKNPFRKFSWISSNDDSSSGDETGSKIKEKSLSFLKSLSNPDSSLALHPDAEKYLKNFKKQKDELASRLFQLFNEKVFENQLMLLWYQQLPSDLKIEWNARLTSCAGKCYNQRNKAVIGPNNECLRVSRIVLSTKILESADRLRDTLIHEMCHAATWIIDRQSGGHGPLWKSWAAKAMKTFPELPSIARCHNYSIKTKYKYTCVKCGYTIGRHSKSLKTDIQLCGYCHGVFELVEKPAKSNTLPKFASFVQENFSKIKSENPHLSQKEIMKELSENFAATKISN